MRKIYWQLKGSLYVELYIRLIADLKKIVKNTNNIAQFLQFLTTNAHNCHLSHNNIFEIINLLKTKLNLLYIRKQSVPRSKRFLPYLLHGAESFLRN